MAGASFKTLFLDKKHTIFFIKNNNCIYIPFLQKQNDLEELI